MYFKIILVCGGYADDAEVQKLHPPIDSRILNSLFKTHGDRLRKFGISRSDRWTKLDSETYEKIIAVIKDIQKDEEGESLWMIEKYWKPD